MDKMINDLADFIKKDLEQIEITNKKDSIVSEFLADAIGEERLLHLSFQVDFYDYLKGKGYKKDKRFLTTIIVADAVRNHNVEVNLKDTLEPLLSFFEIKQDDIDDIIVYVYQNALMKKYFDEFVKVGLSMIYKTIA